MNQSRPVYARLTIGTRKINLGKAQDFETCLTRAQLAMRSERFTDAQVGVIEFSFNKLPDTSALDRESQLMNELNSNLLTDPDEIIYPGVTLSRVWEVMQSPEFIAYSILCQPEKRIGVSQADIDLAIHAYRVTFPDCVEHFPLWVE